MFEQFANALLLEAMFAQWAAPNYELFHDPRGTFPGIGTPRELFRGATATLIALRDPDSEGPEY